MNVSYTTKITCIYKYVIHGMRFVFNSLLFIKFYSMKNKKLYVSFAFCALSFLSKAQIPGYLGKRLVIHANVNSMLTLAGVNAANHGFGERYGEGKNLFALSNRFGLTGEYAVSRKHSISLGVTTSKTGLTLNNIKTLSSNTLEDDRYDEHYLFYNLKSVGGELAWAWYKTDKGALAPMGKHFSFSIWTNMINGKILDKKTYYYNPSINTHGLLSIDPKFVLYGIGISSQENYIFFDKLVLNIGWTIRFPLNSGIIAILREEAPTTSNQDLYNLGAHKRMLYHDLFTMKVDFGYLAF